MHSYIIGKIISINKKSITLEHGYIGYVINVGKPNNFVVGKITKIYLYKHCYITNKSSFSEEFYGFKIYEEKQFFLNCIAISGIGPKTAMNFLQNDINLLKQLIIGKKIDELEKLPGISKKFAYLLTDYLCNYYVKNKMENYDYIVDVVNVLKTLGYSQDDINFAINKLCETNQINNSMETSDIVSMAIKLISTKNEAAIAKA